MPIQLSRSSTPLGAGDEVFPEDWDPVIEELPSPSAPASALGERARRRSEAPAAARTFHGRLEGIGTLEILKALGQSRASGLVSFETHPQGALLLEDGLIAGASWGELSGARALAQLLLLESGSFRVGAHLHEVMTEDTRAPQALLLEALQLVAQRRAIPGAARETSRPLERPSPRRFSLAAAKPSETGRVAVDGHPTANGMPGINGHPAANGKAEIEGQPAANGKAATNGSAAIHDQGGVYGRVGLNGRAALGNHSNGSGSNPGRGALRFLVEPSPSAVANGNHANGKHAPAESNGRHPVTSLERSPDPHRPGEPAPAAPPPSVSLPAGQLRSKSLWWMDSEPPPPPSGLKGETFTRRTLGRIKGAGRLLQPRK